jgi:hypothetical protein
LRLPVWRSEDEAMKSFNHCLGVFLDYTVNKKTLHKEFTYYWQLKKGLKKTKSRTVNDRFIKNTRREELLNKQDIRNH